MSAFDYSAALDPIREDLADAHRHTWDHIASPRCRHSLSAASTIMAAFSPSRWSMKSIA